MRKTRLFYTLVLTFVAILTYAQPRLRVVVVIDGLTQENLSMLRPYWPAGGMRQITEEAHQTTATFPHHVYGGQETMATIMTGSTPTRHSIMADTYFDRDERTAQSILIDEQVTGIGSHLQLSPRSLLSTTLTDEWRIRYGSNAKIYAVGLNPQATILMAGHAANACCWLNADKRRWATSSYYPKGLPSAADEMNINGHITSLASDDWKPRMDIANYTQSTQQERKRGFSYKNQNILLQSPAANTLVIDMALSLQKKQQLGIDITPDLLVLQLNTISPKAQSDMITTAEQEDMYLCINQDLGHLMTQLDKQIGKDKYDIVIVGRPVKGHSQTAFKAANMPINYFNTDRAAALIGTYLMAIYGHERWVDGGYGPFIYLNRMLIERKRMDLEAIQRQVANFLMEFEGVQIAYPIYEAITSDDKASIYRKHAGDVYFNLHDNWLLTVNEQNVFDHVIQSQPTVPVLYWSANKTYNPFTGPIQATDIKSLILK